MVTPPQTDAHIMRVAGQAPTAATGRLVLELKAQGHHEGDDQCHKGLAVAKEVKVRGFVLKIHGDGAVFAGLAGGGSYGASSGQMVGVADAPRWTTVFMISRGGGRRPGFTTKSDGMWIFDLLVESNAKGTALSRSCAYPVHRSQLQARCSAYGGTAHDKPEMSRLSPREH